MNEKQTYRSYKKGDKARNRQIAFRLPESEYKVLEKLAEKHTDSNVSEFVRRIYLQWKKEYTHETKSEI